VRFLPMADRKTTPQKVVFPTPLYPHHEKDQAIPKTSAVDPDSAYRDGCAAPGLDNSPRHKATQTKVIEGLLIQLLEHRS
jgi:hypothetical protein